MVVVVGLAAAGLVGIAVAFYFTVRRGKLAHGQLTASGRRGAGRRPGPPVSAVAGRPRQVVTAGKSGAPSDGSGSAGPSGTRRRVGWRKGADVDEELWPVEAFGGISDEQFWDDLASDKPLATTARTAQPTPDGARSSGPRGRAAPLTAPATTQLIPTARPAASGPQPVPTTRPAAATQPVVAARPAATAATQVIPAVRPSATGTQPTAATRPAATSGLLPKLVARPPAAAGQPARATQPAAAAQPAAAVRAAPAARSLPDRAGAPAAPQDAEARGRRAGRHGNRRSAEEDPLTSAAFALRASGPVDGRSFQRSGGPAREQPPEATHRQGSGASHGGTSPYPAAQRSSHGPTPPYGESYGFGGAQASTPAPANEPTGAETRWDLGRVNEPPYPIDPSGNGQPYLNGRQGGARPNGYPGRGYPADGYRRPHDPWSNGSRLRTSNGGLGWGSCRLGVCLREMWSGTRRDGWTRRWVGGC